MSADIDTITPRQREQKIKARAWEIAFGAMCGGCQLNARLERIRRQAEDEIDNETRAGTDAVEEAAVLAGMHEADVGDAADELAEDEARDARPA